MKQRKLFIRIVALLMALLMAGSVIVVALQIFASAADSTVLTAVAATGSQANETRWPIYAALAAFLVVVVLIVIPIITKKK